MGVDIPDTYNDIYSKSNPQEEKIDVKSLELILVQLSGLPLHLRQQVNCYCVCALGGYLSKNK